MGERDREGEREGGREGGKEREREREVGSQGAKPHWDLILFLLQSILLLFPWQLIGIMCHVEMIINLPYIIP